MSLQDEYQDRFEQLKLIAKDIEDTLVEICEELAHIDRVSVRVKSVDSFVDKAERQAADGTKKYQNPLAEIQDQIGARIIVKYNSDRDTVATKVLDELSEIEDLVKDDPDPGRFGYQARHLVLFIPTHIFNKHKSPIRFFELQISTLFQHAWAEANHDLGYKWDTPLSPDEVRWLSWTASQAWGADRIFDDLMQSRSKKFSSS